MSGRLAFLKLTNLSKNQNHGDAQTRSSLPRKTQGPPRKSGSLGSRKLEELFCAASFVSSYKLQNYKIPQFPNSPIPPCLLPGCQVLHLTACNPPMCSAQ